MIVSFDFQKRTFLRRDWTHSCKFSVQWPNDYTIQMGCKEIYSKTPIYRGIWGRETLR